MSERVLVTGGRSYAERQRVYDALDALDGALGIDVVIEGGADGADRLARHWAITRNKHRIMEEVTEADWARYGKRAGPRRNQAMLDKHKPTVLVVFPGARGTADMTARAKKAGLRILDGARRMWDRRP